MIINTQFVDAAGTPINGTIVVEGNNGAVEAPVIDGAVGVVLDPGDYTVVIFEGGRLVFGPHKMDAQDGKLIRKELP